METPDTSQTVPSLHAPIVAIGASAGGQEAMLELLANLSPNTGMAYVYVQHLDPMQESHLTDILGRATTMTVLEAQHLMPIEADHLYIIPPDRDMELLDGVLTMQPRTSASVIHMPIDRFFLSLAERQKEAAIAVVLSGTASDGTLGLRAIKAAGGITFAQDDSARFQGMPRSDISNGVVDRVLAPADIAHELDRLSSQANLFKQTKLTESGEAESLSAQLDDPTTDITNELRTIIQLLRRATGVDFTHYKITTIRRRIIRRTLLYRLDSLQDYAEYLRQHPDEAMLLYDDLLINVTTFFRDADTMDYLQKVLFPQLIRDKAPNEIIRIWVPACSTGQEAYSIAILLLEVLGERSLSQPIQLFATDLSASAVAKARQGIYTQGEVMDVLPRRLQRFFTKVDDHYRINKSVRDLCVFAPHNLLKDPPFSRLDLVSCRNLLIYLDTTLQRKATVTFHYALNPNGYLVLGKSETVSTSAQLFSQLEKNYKVFARRNDIDSRATFTMTPRQPDGARSAERPAGIPKIINQPGADAGTRGGTTSAASGPATDLDKLIDNLLLTQYIPASVVVNQDMDILQFRGSTGLFLEHAPGKASLNLIKLARPALVFELRNAIHKAQKSGEPVKKNGVEFKARGKSHYANFEAVPLDTATGERLFLILFNEVDMPVTPPANARNKRIQELEIELANLREDMRSIIEEQETSNEELQSANEEIISSNEELQSINEELETSKEEIESTNEELLTINQEFQVRNDQLSEAHQFSEDIFRTIREATLVLDADLRIKSANPAFYRLFQLDEARTNRRLIYELGNRQWDVPELRLMLTDTVTSGAQFQGFELTYSSPETGDKILSLNARRIIRQQDLILLAIEDVTERQRSQQLLAEREAWFHQIADNAPTLIWVTGAEGPITFLNKVWLDYTGRSQNDVMEHGWIESLHPDDQKAYQATFDRHVNSQESFTTEYRLHRRDGEYRWMLENAQPMFTAKGQFSGYIGSSADVHLQHEMNQELDQRVRERTDELMRSNELMQMVLSPSQAGIGRWDWRNRATVWDIRGQQIIGFTSEQEMLSVDGWLNRIHPDDRERVMNQAQESMQTGRDFWLEYRVIHDDDSLHYVLGSGRMKQDEDGIPIGSMGLVIDITSIKKTEQELRQLNSQLSTLLENTPDTITRWDKNLRLLFANSSFSDKIGQPLDTLLNRTYADMGQSGTVATPYMTALQQVLNTGQPREYHSTFPTSIGPAQFFSRMVPEFAPGGTVDSILVIGHDVTELQQAERNLHTTAINLQAILNSSPAAVGFLKPIRDEQQHITDFQLVVCNQEFAAVTRQPIEQLINIPFSQLSESLWHGETVDTIRRVLETGKPFSQERYDADRNEWMLVTLDRYDHGVVLAGQNITLLKNAEQKQRQLLQELEHSNENLLILAEFRQQLRERGEFLRSTSHDLRGNFGIIQGAASLLDMADSDEERAQMLLMLHRNIRQATQMLSELLDVARLEAGQEERYITTFDASQLLRELTESVRPLADERALALYVEGEPTLSIEGDAVKVHRIVQNILLNALKYTQAGSITISWGISTDSPDHWQLVVADTGPGLTANYTTTSGEGIGLLIVRQLCELLNCQLDIDSQPDRGTRVTVRFPRAYTS